MTKVSSEKDVFGNIRWYKEGTDILHRENGPAVEFANGTKAWYQNGKYHRTDGPAIEYVDGNKYYYLNNKYCPDIKTDEDWLIFQIIN